MMTRLRRSTELPQIAGDARLCHKKVIHFRHFPLRKRFSLRFAGWPSAATRQAAFMASVPFILQVVRGAAQLTPSKQSKRSPKKPSCDECYFRCNLLCALDLPEPCTTFRPNEAQLQPPQQLRFVFRQERRTRAAWAFPSAQEQAALYA
jgi:hypothetical protein